MSERAGTELPARARTIRAEIIAALRDGWHDSLELSQRVGIPEREVAAHLEHIQRSLARGPERLDVVVSSCRDCGFEPTKRRLSRPGRCPKCRGQRVQRPRFQIGS